MFFLHLPPLEQVPVDPTPAWPQSRYGREAGPWAAEMEETLQNCAEFLPSTRSPCY